MQTLMDHYLRNELLIRRVRLWVGTQAVLNFFGTALLIAGLLALGSAS